MKCEITTDICIIGAGSGGLSLAAGAVQMGAKVVLVEGGKMGGDCLNTGCVPSKALLAAAKQAHAMAGSERFGVTDASPRINFKQVNAHVQRVIAGIAPHDSVERFESLGVRVVQAYGKFISPSELQAGDTCIKARRFVIATGSSPFVPPIKGIEDVDYLTNDDLFDLTKLPKKLIIIGGGPIGMEMAQAHSRLGSDVTVLEGMKALGKDDPEMAAVVLKEFRAEGIKVVEDALVEEISKTKRGITVHTSDGKNYTGTDLLMAVGRKPNTDGLDLDTADVKTTRRGVEVDKSLRTSNRKIYAIGDVAGSLQFTHMAGYHAGIVIRSALMGLPAKTSDRHIPWATYTDPEMAQVGLTEGQAQERYGKKLEILKFDYDENDRARTELKTKGFIKVMVVKGKPVGASIVGAQAGELIQTWALVIANKLKIGAVAAMVSPYPTLGEINKRVAGQYYTPRLFESPVIKSIVRTVQRLVP